MNIEVGMNVFANWGAMYPVVYGVVDRIENDIVYFYDKYCPEEVYTTTIESIKPIDPTHQKIGVFA